MHRDKTNNEHMYTDTQIDEEDEGHDDVCYDTKYELHIHDINNLALEIHRRLKDYAHENAYPFNEYLTINDVVMFSEWLIG